jgi:hypothetical protein
VFNFDGVEDMEWLFGSICVLCLTYLIDSFGRRKTERRKRYMEYCERNKFTPLGKE